MHVTSFLGCNRLPQTNAPVTLIVAGLPMPPVKASRVDADKGVDDTAALKEKETLIQLLKYVESIADRKGELQTQDRKSVV